MRRTYHQIIHFLSRYRTIAIWVVFAFWCPILLADTTWVAGDVYGTWTREGNPYMVTDTLTIPHDSTLNILPGVQIFFQNQYIRRTSIIVYGQLLAVGEEGDSVYFSSQEAAFGSIWNLSTPGTEIRLEYCVVDSFYSPIRSSNGSLVLKHCRLHRVGPSPFYAVWGNEEIDTVQNCILGNREVYFEYGGPGVFQYNQGGGISSFYNVMAPIFGNVDMGAWFNIYGGVCPEVFNNVINGIDLTEVFCDVHDNQIFGGVDITWCTSAFHNNYIAAQPLFFVHLYESQVVMTDNIIYNVPLSVNECDFTLQKNLIVTPMSTAITIIPSLSNLIQGNTIIFGTNGIYANLTIGYQTEIIDNIFVGDGEGCTAINLFAPRPLSISYNDFYQVNTYTYNCQPDTGNIFLDPHFRAGNPYDYQLQANSPCIDAGDPNSPLDPDGTRADMGCYFFDHSIDNPPAIISPVLVNVQRGTTMRYIAQATDDFGPLNFGFWNLPLWLYQVSEQMDFMQKYAVLQGQIPQGQGDFTFGIWVQDGSAQRDSQEVSVLVSQYTILAGEVNGELTIEHSPYLVVDEIVVPEGDSLRIDPGVEVFFQRNETPDYRHRIRVRGTLCAIGTIQDSIRFVPELGSSSNPAWLGILIAGSTGDTSRFCYTYLYNGRYGVQVDSQAAFEINHSKIEDALYAINVSNNAQVKVDSCVFRVNNPTWHCFVLVDSASVSVESSFFEICQTPNQDGSHLYFSNAKRSSVRNCVFSGGRGLQIDHSSQLDFIGNRIINTTDGLGYGNGASGIVSNNIFINGNGLFIYEGDSILANNNLFYHTSIGIDITYLPVEVSIENSLFIENNIGIQLRYGSELFQSLNYCCFFNNDTDFVNCINHETSIFIDPAIQDTIDFRLSIGSPCINAGDPDPFFNDVDSTRNDIGCWGGPWGESYPYVSVLSHQPKPLPQEFALLPPYPNPFNSVLIIPFILPVEAEVTITIYNILGQRVHQYTSPPLSPGVHRVVWNSGSCASGLYIIRLISGGKEFKQKAVLIK